MSMESNPGDAAADFAAQWQTEHPGGAQVEVEADSEGTITDIGPTIYPDGEGEP